MTSRPDVLPAHDWRFPTPAVTRLDNGLAVWAYDLPGQFIVSSNLVLELPLNAEPPEHEGVATLAVRTLDEGTLAHPGPSFAAAMEEVGAEFNGLVGLSTTQCLLDVPCDSFTPALQLFAEAATTPAFDPDDVGRIKANRLAELDQQESRGSYVAATALRSALVDTNLRISRPVSGSRTGVESTQAADVATFRDAHYRPEDAVLIVAGDLTGIDVITAAAAAFGNWRPVTTPVLPDPVATGTGSRRLIHREAAVQADVRIGWFGIDRCDPRWADLQVALAIIGGTFTSRLNTVLREERGYTYGIHMNAHPFRSGGLVDVVTSTRTATAHDLIGEALELLAAREPFSDEETAAAIGYLTGSAPLAFGTAEAVASQAASLAAARLDLDHVTASLAALGRVTPQSALAAYRDLVDPEQASIIVAADANEVPDLGFGITV